MPASPPNVYSAQPIFSPRRLISAMPRVMRAARALSPLPSPLEMPTASASMFFIAPHSSTPSTSVFV